MRGIFASIAGGVLAIGLITQAQAATGADRALEARLNEFTQSQETAKQKSSIDWVKAAKTFASMPAKSKVIFDLGVCNETRSEEFGGRYVITYDVTAQKPCKVYDLSFPTLASAVGSFTVAKLPVQRFTSKDYLAWIEGRYEDVYSSVKSYNSEFKAEEAVKASWVSGLKFKADRATRLTFMARGATGGLPVEFKASDLELGRKFAFNDYDRALLNKMIRNASAQAFGGWSLEKSDAYSEIINNPDSLLEKIRFVWNDAEKVYEVAIQGDFLPIVGPVALVDFENPYKPAMEGMIRSVLSSAVLRLVGFIPEPFTQRLVSVAMTDAFGFLEGMYTYQMNYLETSLRLGANGVYGADATDVYSRAVDLEFSTRSGFFNDYVMAVAQGKRFDWAQIEKIGRKARYAAEKQRDISMNKRHSDLVIKSSCETRIFQDYFAVCTRANEQVGIYSLLSESSVLFWSFGAPLVHRPGFRSEVLLKRATTRLLASGLRVVRLPILDFLTETLANELQKFAMTGMEDEAFLRGGLAAEKLAKGSLDADSTELMKWLYLQNINPFLPKSEAGEGRIIDANRALLTSKLSKSAPAEVGAPQ